jgi:hypothetical protein
MLPSYRPARTTRDKESGNEKSGTAPPSQMADFELGSGTPILLDYRHDVTCPRVIRLKWNPLPDEMMLKGRKKVSGWANVWLVFTYIN